MASKDLGASAYVRDPKVEKNVTASGYVRDPTTIKEVTATGYAALTDAPAGRYADVVMAEAPAELRERFYTVGKVDECGVVEALERALALKVV